MEIKTLEGIDIERITNVFNLKLMTTVYKCLYGYLI